MCGFRFGEAINPGPVVEELDGTNEMFCLSTSNPDGLSTRLGIVESMPWGLHGFAETQMTSKQSVAFLGSLRAQRRRRGEEAYMVTGSDIPTRQVNSERGCWSGVAVVSHVPVRDVQLTWPELAYSTGRVAVVATEIHGVPLMGAVVYGFAHSQTHSHPGAQTDELLRCLSQELVLGRNGCRFILGDLNESRHEHPQKLLWRHQGWQEIQSSMASQGEHVLHPTCKGSTFQDQLWCSPELLQFLRKVEVSDSYWPTHSVVAGYFDFQSYQRRTNSWPQPSFIPWGQVNLQSWRETVDQLPPWTWGEDSTAAMAQWSRRVEESLHGHLDQHDQMMLPSACLGRGTRLQPESRPAVAPLAKPSREGEVRRCHDLLGRKALEWYQQLRRIQALYQSLKNRKLSDEACLYRATLWRSILKARGFKQGFKQWWTRRHIQLPDAPSELPTVVPPFEVCEMIFQDYQVNFRSFETYQIQARQSALKLRMQEDEHIIYKQLRPPPARQLEILEKDQGYVIKEVNYGNRVRLDPPFSQGHGRLCLDGEPVQVFEEQDDWVRIEGDVLLRTGVVLQATDFIWDEERIAAELIAEWSPRWQRHEVVQLDQWKRVTDFAEAFFPRQVFQLKPLTVEVWEEAVKHYKQSTSRGPDSWSRDDLFHLGPKFNAELVQLLQKIEDGLEWPTQTMQAIVVLLKKHATARLVGEYRPIVVMSLIYRVWASIRARDLLAQFGHVFEHHSFGFLPKRGALQYWWSLQSSIEVALQTGESLSGLTADIVKAYNFVPREPIYKLAEIMGVPANLVVATATAFQNSRFCIRWS